MPEITSRETDDDIDATDELPVLSEAVMVTLAEQADPAEAPASTDGQPLAFPQVERRREFAQRIASLERRLDARDTAVGDLGHRIGELSRGWQSVEAQLGRNAAAIEVIADQLMGLREQLGGSGEQKAAEPRERDDPRAEVAALTAYITNRREHWDALEARVAEQTQRIRELETELEQRLARQHEAEELASRESARAAEYRDELARLAAPGPGDSRAPRTNAKLARRLAARDDGAAPEALADLERLLVEVRGALDEQREQLGAAGDGTRPDADGDPVHERLVAAQADLEQARAGLRHLEPALLERERAADDQSARIAALQTQLSEQVARLRDLQNTAAIPRAHDEVSADEPASPAAAPPAAADADVAERGALVCLTSERPEHYPIAKRVLIIGRDTQADVRIATQFVSREHACVRNDGRSVLIEDLGSTNGVFVNSVRVDSQELCDGDWITIGDTQFRYVASAPA